MSKITQGIVAISLEDEKILANGKVIGVTKEHFNAMLDKLEDYEAMLIEAGIIEAELTQDEIIEQTKDALAKSHEALAKSNALAEKLMARLDALEKQGESKNVQKSTATGTAKKRNDGGSGADNGLSAASNGDNGRKGDDGKS